MAGFTDTVHHDGVLLGDESHRQMGVEMAGAARQIKNPLAGAAGKMVVMGESGQLIPRTLTRQIDRGQRTIVDQPLDCSIDGGDAHSTHPFARLHQDFLVAQRPRGNGEGLANGAALSSIPFHGAILRRTCGQTTASGGPC